MTNVYNIAVDIAVDTNKGDYTEQLQKNDDETVEAFIERVTKVIRQLAGSE